MNDRDRAELRRAQKLMEQVGDQQRDEALHAMQPAMDALYDHALEVNKVLAQSAQSVDEAARALVERMNRLALDAVAAFNAQLVEMSRQIQMSVAAQMARVPSPRIEIFRPTLDRVVPQIEIPYHLPPTPAPVGGMAPLPSQPSVPARGQELAQQIMVGVVTSVVSALLVSAILVFAQTGLWVFEELLCYFVQLVKQLD